MIITLIMMSLGKKKERMLEDNHIPLKLRMLDEQVNMSLALQSIH